MHKRVLFRQPFLPYLLVLPQMAITLIFFFWPAGQAIKQSLYREDPFGLSSNFVGAEQLLDTLANPNWQHSVGVTILFSLAVAALSLGLALLLAVAANGIGRGKNTYQTLLIWPYAVAPAIAGVLWMFMFHPSIGTLGRGLIAFGYDWNYLLHGDQALWLVIFASVWKQISYNFIFFLAGLRAIPKSLIEAAAIDGAGPIRRFWTIVFPLLSPTGFFLLVVNIVYAFFDTFGVIHAVTHGGPARATEILVFKVYYDGVVGLDLGGSAAQSVILMVLVVALTVIQFRFIERRVHY